MTEAQEESSDPRQQLSLLLKAWRAEAGLAAVKVDEALHARSLIDSKTNKFTSQMEHGKGRLTRARCEALSDIYERDADTLWRYWLRASVEPDVLAFFDGEVEKASGGVAITDIEGSLVKVMRSLEDRYGIDIRKGFMSLLVSAVSSHSGQSDRTGPAEDLVMLLGGYSCLPLHVQHRALAQMASTMKLLQQLWLTAQTTPFLKKD